MSNAEMSSEASSFLIPKSYIPPKNIMYGGSSTVESYISVSQHFFLLFLKYGRIRPDSCILDVGSGSGRMCLFLTQYLSDKGSYTGFDPIYRGPTWCTENITPHHPNFTFKHIPFYNKHYSPNGDIDPATYTFPYPADSFDFIFLTSVFTHLQTHIIRNYLNELSRIIKPGHRIFATFFLLNDFSRQQIETGLSAVKLEHPIDGHSLCKNLEKIEEAIGHDENVIYDMIKESGLEVVELLYGGWCKREPNTSYQDIIIMTKK